MPISIWAIMKRFCVRVLLSNETFSLMLITVVGADVSIYFMTTSRIDKDGRVDTYHCVGSGERGLCVCGVGGSKCDENSHRLQDGGISKF